MDKIDVGMFFQPSKQAAAVFEVERIPPDVRNLQPRCFGDAADAPFQNAEARNARRFFAFLEQHLQAEADAEKRPAGTDKIQHGLFQAGTVQAGHRVAERPDTRQYGGRSFREYARVGGYDGVAADEAERFDDALQVSGAIIKNCYHTASPFAFTIYHSIA